MRSADDKEARFRESRYMCARCRQLDRDAVAQRMLDLVLAGKRLRLEVWHDDEVIATQIVDGNTVDISTNFTGVVSVSIHEDATGEMLGVLVENMELLGGPLHVGPLLY